MNAPIFGMKYLPATSAMPKLPAALEQPDPGQPHTQTGERRINVAQEPLFESGATVF